MRLRPRNGTILEAVFFRAEPRRLGAVSGVGARFPGLRSCGLLAVQSGPDSRRRELGVGFGAMVLYPVIRKLLEKRVVLASASPRRQEILSNAVNVRVGEGSGFLGRAGGCCSWGRGTQGC